MLKAQITPREAWLVEKWSPEWCRQAQW
uniref:Uncharacterized protein n=1 Tax=Arundo donax TaxID=35708 RepID=A0A0A9APS8_ARUDO